MALAALLAVALVYFLPLLWQGNRQVVSAIDADTWSQFFYWRRFAFGMLARGELPLWNPYNFTGQPFVGAMQSAIFYPPNLLFLIFDTALAINLSVALHCLGASLFTYGFARYSGVSPLGAALAGATFAYSAPYFLHIYAGHLPHLAAMWMPLVFLAMAAFLRRGNLSFALLAGAVLALQILAGYPQYSFYSGLAASLYFALHALFLRTPGTLSRWLVGYGLFAGGALLLSAVQLVPALEMVQNSARGAVSFDWISIFSLPPENLLTLIFPNAFGDMVNVPYWGKNNLWEMSVYLGIAPLTLMMMAIALVRNRDLWVLAIIAALFLLLALGKHTPFLWLLYSFVPGFSLFRGVGKAAFVFAFAAAVLAGFGLDRVRSMIATRDRKLVLLIRILIGFAGVALAGAFLSPAGESTAWGSLVRAYTRSEEHFDSLLLDPAFLDAARRMLWLDVAKMLLLAFALGSLCYAGWRGKNRPAQLGAALIVALTCTDLWHYGQRFVVSFDPATLSMDAETRAFLKRDTGPYRIATPLAPLRNHLLNAGMVEGIENVGGYDAIVVKQFSEFINFTQGLPVEHPNLLMGINRVSPLLNMMNVRYYLLDPAIDLNLPGFELVFQNRRDKIYRSRNAAPRSFIVHDTRVARGVDDAFRELSDPRFDPLATAIVDRPVIGMPPNALQRSPTPRIVHYSLRRVVIDAEAGAPGLLILADSYYPGWKAFIDGKQAEILRANHAMRAVVLPAGRHKVEFYYDPISLKIGAAISVISLLLLVVILGISAWDQFRKRAR